MLQEEIKLTQFPSFKHAFKQGRTMVVVVPCDVLATVLIIHYLKKVVRHEHKSHNQDVYAENWSINCPLDCKNYSASGGTPQTPLWGNCTLAAHQWSAPGFHRGTPEHSLPHTALPSDLWRSRMWPFILYKLDSPGLSHLLTLTVVTVHDTFLTGRPPLPWARRVSPGGLRCCRR